MRPERCRIKKDARLSFIVRISAMKQMSDILAFQRNANNGWIFNGTNGNLRNNNRVNTNYARVFHDSYSGKWKSLQSSLIPLAELYRWYFICRKGKRNSRAQLEYEHEYPKHLRRLHDALNNREYIPAGSIWFILEYPTLREVIAPEFPDRPVQTMWCKLVRPHIEKMLDDNSFACRIGRGSINAIGRFAEQLLEESDGGRRPCRIVKLDQKSFFLHIYKPLLVEMYRNVINDRFEGELREFMGWLCEKLHLSCPQEHIRREHPVSFAEGLPPYKRREMLPWHTGVDIGNRVAQMGGNFMSTLYLNVLRYFGYDLFVHYSDDAIIAIREDRLRQFLNIVMPALRKKESEVRLELNERKFYCQDARHGVQALGFFVKIKKGDIVILPDKRIIHNLKRLAGWYIERATTGFIMAHKEDFVSRINSHFGLLVHSNSFRIRCEVARLITDSPWGRVIEFRQDYQSCRIKKRFTHITIRKYLNNQYKQNIKNYGINITQNQCPQVKTA